MAATTVKNTATVTTPAAVKQELDAFPLVDSQGEPTVTVEEFTPSGEPIPAPKGTGKVKTPKNTTPAPKTPGKAPGKGKTNPKTPGKGKTPVKAPKGKVKGSQGAGKVKGKNGGKKVEKAEPKAEGKTYTKHGVEVTLRPTPKGQRAEVFGFTAVAVLRWMGFKGWKVSEAVAVLEKLGLDAVVAVPTVRTQVGEGRHGEDSVRGGPADLTKEQGRVLTALKPKAE